MCPRNTAFNCLHGMIANWSIDYVCVYVLTHSKCSLEINKSDLEYSYEAEQ